MAAEPRRAGAFQRAVRVALVRTAREAQRRNGGDPAGSDAEIIELCGQLYRAIVPAASGETGASALAAAGFSAR